MALTLAQAELFSTNDVYRGVVEEFLRMSPVFGYLPFLDVDGNAYQYVRESTRSSVAWRDPEETWTESVGTVAQVTVALKILGGDADIDNFLKSTRSNYVDIESELIHEKVKQTKFTYLDTFYYGNTTTNAKEFPGLHSLVTSGQTTSQGSSATGAALSMANLDVLVDAVQGDPPDYIVTTKAIRRRINQYIRANGGTYNETRDEWGNTISLYNGVPLYADESLVQTETIASGTFSAKTGGSTGSLFAVTNGPKAMFGIQNSGSIQVFDKGELEMKDARRWRIRWYAAAGLGATVSLARLDGVTNVAAVS